MSDRDVDIIDVPLQRTFVKSLRRDIWLRLDDYNRCLSTEGIQWTQGVPPYTNTFTSTKHIRHPDVIVTFHMYTLLET